jgi:Fe-S cluster biogenesis protein NfuA
MEGTNMKDKVEKALDQIRPMLQGDGGNVQLISVDEASGVVKVKLTGACGCCPHATMTLKLVVERKIREEVPEVKQVLSV